MTWWAQRGPGWVPRVVCLATGSQPHPGGLAKLLGGGWGTAWCQAEGQWCTGGPAGPCWAPGGQRATQMLPGGPNTE